MKGILLLLLLLLGLISASPVYFFNSEVTESSGNFTYRLPNNTFPLRYDLDILTNLHLPDENPDKFKFSGKIRIHVQVEETSNFVTLKARQMTILSSRLWNARGEVLEWIDGKQPEFQEKGEFLTFRVKDHLFKNEVVLLEIDYVGELRTDMGGFHRLSYADKDGNRRWLAATQFSATNARHAFPCYDEPKTRAVFGVTLRAHKSFQTLSNMPPIKQTEDEFGIVTTVFKDTPPMQSYIVALAVTDYYFIARETTLDVEQRIYGRPEAMLNNEGEFALSTGMKVLRHQQEYFDTKYDLPRVAHIALPSMAGGAMENWGLVTYRESLLLYDEQKPSYAAKRRIANIIAHELAHMFFGNLVAPNFWHYLWLSEGFANFYEYHFIAQIYPEYRDSDYYVANAVQYALQNDATENTTPMTTFSDNADALPAANGFVVYSKAGSVLRMLQLGLTEATFRKGVTYYIKAKQYDVADSDDLARGLERAAREDNVIERSVQMKDVVDSWALKSHYPVVTVEREDKGRLKLSQRLFSYKPKNSTETWFIPITLATGTDPLFENTRAIAWWNSPSIVVAPTTRLHWTDQDWVLLNVQQMGFFRVNYEDALWEKLIVALKSENFGAIHHLNRAQLVDDSLNLARAGLLSYFKGFQVLEYLTSESEFVPWMAFNNNFDFIHRLLADLPLYGSLKMFLRDMVSPLFTDLGVEDRGSNEVLPEKTKRTIAIKWACLAGNENCTETARAQVENIVLKNQSRPVPDVEQPLFCAGSRRAGQQLFESSLEFLQDEKDSAFRSALIRSFGCVEEPQLQNQYLDSTLRDSRYRESEKSEVVYAVIQNGGAAGVRSTIEFLSKSFLEIQETFKGSRTPVLDACKVLSEYITSKELAEQYESLLDHLVREKVFPDSEKALVQAIVKENLDWVEKNEDDIERFLEGYLSKKLAV